MLEIKTFTFNPFQENTYVVSDETKECVVIDCGASSEAEQHELSQYIAEQALQVKHLIATHAHIDHNFGNAYMERQYGTLLQVHEADEPLAAQFEAQAMSFCQMSLPTPLPPVGKWLTAEDVIRFGTHELTIIETPGHTPGSVFFYCADENVAFSGDTLFHNSVGRTDLPGGNTFLLIQSLRTISQLPDNTTIYPGHGPHTTMGIEQTSNPYLDR